MTLHFTFSASLQHHGVRVEQAEVDADRILFTDGRMQLLRGGEVLAEWPTDQVAEIELRGGEKSFSVDEVRADHPRAYLPWTEEEEQRLLDLKAQGLGHAAIGKELGRQPSAIRSRLEKLGER